MAGAAKKKKQQQRLTLTQTLSDEPELTQEKTSAADAVALSLALRLGHLFFFVRPSGCLYRGSPIDNNNGAFARMDVPAEAKFYFAVTRVRKYRGWQADYVTKLTTLRVILSHDVNYLLVSEDACQIAFINSGDDAAFPHMDKDGTILYSLADGGKIVSNCTYGHDDDDRPYIRFPNGLKAGEEALADYRGRRIEAPLEKKGAHTHI